MKKKAIIAITLALVLCFAFIGCSSQSSSSGSSAAASAGSAQAEQATEPQEGSLRLIHQALGQDLSQITEVSIDTCSKCHDWEKIVSDTEGYWKGLGQITDANPHASHATNAFACSDCHKLNDPQVNICNQCHIFETPQGWVEKDKTTTNYGIKATESQY